jgi:hypothetical protein
MTIKGFGAREINIIGIAGTPVIDSSDNLILGANTVFVEGEVVAQRYYGDGSSLTNIKPEAFNKYSATIGSGSTVTIDCSSGSIYYVTSTIGGNWTANLTNTSIPTGYASNFKILITQGTVVGIPTAVQISGVSTSVNWQGGSIPSGNSNKKDVIAYTIFNDSGNYTVLGQLVSFG